MKTTKPAGFEPYLGDFGPVSFDGICGEPVAWGFPLVERMSQEKFSELARHGELYYRPPNGGWCLVVRRLTRQEAAEKYGPLSDISLGPRGGFRSVTYGTTTFCNKGLAP